jgi:V/A-type H+-transporting ATPase subunit B
VVALDNEALVLEVLESTLGLGMTDTRIILRDEPLQFAVGPGILGRVFDSIGQPIDGGPRLPAELELPVDGLPINPSARLLPQAFIETGVTTIDLMNSLVRGQKLPIFSGGGLPHDRLAVEIAQRARCEAPRKGFALVFAGMVIA